MLIISKIVIQVGTSTKFYRMFREYGNCIITTATVGFCCIIIIAVIVSKV